MCRKELIRVIKRVLNYRMEFLEVELFDFLYLNVIFKINLGFGFIVVKILCRNLDNLVVLKLCCFLN